MCKSGGTGAVRELCDVFDEARSAGRREKLRRIDNELREKIRKVMPD